VIEGFALASSLLVSQIGPLVLIGILAHKAPAGFALTSILRLAGKTNRQILAFVLGVALSVPLGAVLAYVILEKSSLHKTAGILLSVSAGTFLYIAACDLLPELHRNDSEKFKRLFAFLVGIALCLAGLLLEK
jgi:zinc transporter ZupT